ncbi:MAG: hypothetical protein EOM54_02935 [Clostridia bacterium]|nr:hypothetical protein [Clostridia bacterium]
MDIMLVINALAHLIVDGVCAAALFGPVWASGDIVTAVLLYNTLAFSTQCVVGLVTDRLKGHERIAAVSLAAVALGFLLPLPWVVRVFVIGLGNSVFHVTAGTVTLKRSEGRAGPLGVFVAPGAVGLSLGTLYPMSGTYFAVAALLFCMPMALGPINKSAKRICRAQGAGSGVESRYTPPIRQIKTPWLAVCALLVAVAVRAVGGMSASFPWKTTAALSLITVAFVFSGKIAGGFVCDRLGAKKTALISIPAAAVLIAFGSAWMAPSVIGQLLLNLTMPVTLWLIYRAMPDSPGLAFGLAASALWPGTIAGNLMALSGTALWACILVSFLFGLFAILYSDKKLREVET